MMNLFGGKHSFFDLERKKIENFLKLPLLELVLEYLPHLQLTIQQQDDLWEMIAIKLNNHQFVESFLKSTNSKVKDPELILPDELPTLNGVFVKELFEKIMSSFEKRVESVNRNRNIYKNNVVVSNNNQQGTMYMTFNFPVKEAYSSPEDIICCELFYMKSLAVDTKAEISRQKLIDNIKNKSMEQIHQDIKHELEKVKNDQQRVKLETCLLELDRKNQRIETLDKENKRLMELNQALLDEVTQLRQSKFG